MTLAEQLLKAAESGDADATRALLASPRAAAALNGGAGVQPPLIAAAAYGHVDICRMLLAAGADVDVNDGLSTALLYAADHGHLLCIRELLAKGATIDPRSMDGSEETPLLCAAGSGHLPCVQALVDAGADVQARTDRGGSPLYLACQNGHTECARALLRAGADVQIREQEGATVMHAAAMGGQPAIISQLLQAGAAPQLEARTHKGLLPLHVAAQAGRRAAAEQLLCLGTPLEATDAHGQTPLGYAVGHLVDSLNYRCDDAAQAAAIKARYLNTIRFLLAAGANPNAAWRAERVNPLLYASQGTAFGPLPEVIQALLEAGADPEQADAQGRTPLFLPTLLSSTHAGHLRVVALLQAAIAAKQQARRAAAPAPAGPAAPASAPSGSAVTAPAPAGPADAAPASPRRACAACGRSADQLGPQQKLHRCAGCEAVRYCSVECQKAAWPEHRKECRRLAQLGRLNSLRLSPAAGRLSACRRAPVCAAYIGRGSFVAL